MSVVSEGSMYISKMQPVKKIISDLLVKLKKSDISAPHISTNICL